MAWTPLLTSASWPLMPAGRPPRSVLWAGTAIWGLGTAMMLAWVAALVHEALVWGAPISALTLGLFAALTWLVLAWRAWRCWHGPHPAMTLRWLGPVSKRALSNDSTVTAAQGFQIEPGAQAVRPIVVFDFQHYMLLRLQPLALPKLPHARRPGHTWVWLDMTQPGAWHGLKTLLNLPASMTVPHHSRPSPAVQGRTASRPMASWPPIFNTGSKLRRSVISSRGHGRSADHPSAQDTDFLPTEWLGDDDRHASARVGRGGAQ